MLWDPRHSGEGRKLGEVPTGLAKTAGPIVQEALRLLVERRCKQTHTSGARCPGLPLGLVGSFQMRMYHTRHPRQFKIKQNTAAGSSTERRKAFLFILSFIYFVCFWF